MKISDLPESIGIHQSSREGTGLAERTAQLGWLAKGLIFVIIGLLGFELSRQGFAGEAADQTGALAALSDVTFGRILVLGVGGGLWLFALWQWWSAIVGPRDGVWPILQRIGDVGLGAAYALIGTTGLTSGIKGTRPADGDGEALTSPEGVSRLLFDFPGGRIVVAAIGIITIVIALYQLRKGWRFDFLDDIDLDGLSEESLTTLCGLGIVGFTARSLVLCVAGSLFLIAAWTLDAGEAAGLDRSLRLLIEAPGGRSLLGITSVGLIASGVYDGATFRRQRLNE